MHLDVPTTRAKSQEEPPQNQADLPKIRNTNLLELVPKSKTEPGDDFQIASFYAVKSGSAPYL
jgi:hypothetical protein